MINHIISSPQKQASSRALAYHYCEFSNPATLDPSNIVGSLVRQAHNADGQHSTCLFRISTTSVLDKPRSSMHSWNLLYNITTETFETTYLILDGLDESPRTASYFSKACGGLAKQRTAHVRSVMLLSSRPEYDIRQALCATPTFIIKPQHVEVDMETHVRAELAKMPKLRTLNVSTQDSLISDLVKRADGMFRWIQCQLDMLQRIRTLQSTQRRSSNSTCGPG